MLFITFVFVERTVVWKSNWSLVCSKKRGERPLAIEEMVQEVEGANTATLDVTVENFICRVCIVIGVHQTLHRLT